MSKKPSNKPISGGLINRRKRRSARFGDFQPRGKKAQAAGRIPRPNTFAGTPTGASGRSGRKIETPKKSVKTKTRK